MRRNFWKQGAVMAMAGMLAMSAFLAVPALPAGATAAETGIPDLSVVGDDAMQEELSENLSEKLNSDVGSLENDYTEIVEMLASERNGETEAETDAAGVTRAGAEVLTGTIGRPDGDGNVLEWSYDESIQTLTITGSGVLTGGDRLLAGALSSMEIRKIEFRDCKVAGTMDSAFSERRYLEEIDFSGLDTSSVTGMSYMFSGCSGLTGLDLSSFDTRSVTGMTGMFHGCSNLRSLDIGSFNTENVTHMDGMFRDCSSLISLDLSSFDTSSVIYINGMFWGCSNLISLDLSSFDTSSVTTMNCMFRDCSSLSSLDLSSFNTSNVIDMQFVFQNCVSLSNLDLSNFDTSSAVYMRYMFFTCSSLNGLDLSGFDTSSVTDMQCMFAGCSSLNSLDLSSFDTSSVTDMGTMFEGCDMLFTLHTPYNVKISAILPTVSNTVWHLPDGTEVTELPQGLSASVLITRTPVIITTTEALNMPDVIRVKYVPYSYTVQTNNTDPDNQVTFSVVEGKLAEGLQMYPATGEIYGVPLEAGEFNVKVQASYSNPKYPAAYAELKLIVLDNTDSNVGTATDSGYEITRPVPDINAGALSGAGTQLLVSEGEYAEFQDAVYLDGRRLQSGTEYTSEAGSTRVTIQNQTLANAGAGSHTLSLEFRTQDGDLRRAAQNLVISDVGGTGDAGNNGTTDNNGNTGSTDNNAGNTDSTDNNAGSSMDNGADDGQDTASASNTVTVIDYIVQPGDTLWRISGKFFGDSSHWRQIYMDNMDVLRNPDRIRVGQHLKIYLTAGNGAGGAITIPAAAASGIGGSYVVQQGDNLWKIAGKVYGKSTRWGEIYEANRSILSDPERIYTKQVLIIP